VAHIERQNRRCRESETIIEKEGVTGRIR